MLNFTRPERPAPKEPDTKSATRAAVSPSAPTSAAASPVGAAPRPPLLPVPHMTCRHSGAGQVASRYLKAASAARDIRVIPGMLCSWMAQ